VSPETPHTLLTPTSRLGAEHDPEALDQELLDPGVVPLRGHDLEAEQDASVQGPPPAVDTADLGRYGDVGV
jgi:hypothetical protein